jgi:hypothetical protein
MGFLCSSCKNTFGCDPSLKNGAGSFCKDCHKKMHDKMIAVNRKRLIETDGVCKYCGEIAEPFQGDPNETVHVCKKCTGTIIPHILKCIRYSDKIAKYVASREEKESTSRKSREAARIIASESQAIKAPEDRITRLEGMLEELLQHITKPK